MSGFFRINSRGSSHRNTDYTEESLDTTPLMESSQPVAKPSLFRHRGNRNSQLAAQLSFASSCPALFSGSPSSAISEAGRSRKATNDTQSGAGESENVIVQASLHSQIQPQSINRIPQNPGNVPRQIQSASDNVGSAEGVEDNLNSADDLDTARQEAMRQLRNRMEAEDQPAGDEPCVLHPIKEFCVNYEACLLFCFWFILYSFAAMIFFEQRILSKIFPKINSNIDRPRCIFEQTNVTFLKDCLPDEKVHLLNQTFVDSYCRRSLKNAFEFVCRQNETNRRTVDNLPIIDGKYFVGQLRTISGNQPIDNVTVLDLQTMCVRIFQNNPLGDVEVRPTANQDAIEKQVFPHDFVYRNRALLMTVCLSSPPLDSHVFAEMPIFFDRRLMVLWYFPMVGSVSLVFMGICVYIRYVKRTSENYDEEPLPESVGLEFLGEGDNTRRSSEE